MNCPKCGAPERLDAQGRCLYCETPYAERPPSGAPVPAVGSPMWTPVRYSLLRRRQMSGLRGCFLGVGGCVLLAVLIPLGFMLWLFSHLGSSFGVDGRGGYCSPAPCLAAAGGGYQVDRITVTRSVDPPGLRVQMHLTVFADTPPVVRAGDFTLVDSSRAADRLDSAAPGCTAWREVAATGTLPVVCFRTSSTDIGSYQLHWSDAPSGMVDLGAVGSQPRSP